MVSVTFWLHSRPYTEYDPQTTLHLISLIQHNITDFWLLEVLIQPLGIKSLQLLGHTFPKAVFQTAKTGIVFHHYRRIESRLFLVENGHRNILGFHLIQGVINPIGAISCLEGNRYVFQFLLFVLAVKLLKAGGTQHPNEQQIGSQYGQNQKKQFVSDGKFNGSGQIYIPPSAR